MLKSTSRFYDEQEFNFKNKKIIIKDRLKMFFTLSIRGNESPHRLHSLAQMISYIIFLCIHNISFVGITTLISKIAK